MTISIPGLIMFVLLVALVVALVRGAPLRLNMLITVLVIIVLLWLLFGDGVVRGHPVHVIG